MNRWISLLLVIVLAVLAPAISQARYLNPDTGRFQTMDSYEGNSQDPQSLHKYLYAHCDPVNGIDPNGHYLIIEQETKTGIQGEMARRILPAIARSAARAIVTTGRAGVRLGLASTTVIDPVAMLLARNVMVAEATLIAAAVSFAVTPVLLELEELEEEAKGQVVYRAMRGDKMPTIGDASGLELGIRDGSQAGSNPVNDVPNVLSGAIQPTAQGMSVTPDFPGWLPIHALKAVGQGKAKVWGYHLGIMDSRLTYRPDPFNPKKHGFIGVTAPMPLSEYRDLIHATQPTWVPLQP